MPEVRRSFNSAEEWQLWRREVGELDSTRHDILTDVRARGFTEPFTGTIRFPHSIGIRETDLHESISSHELNSRKRALLVQLILELQSRGSLDRRTTRILGAEALSRTALILRGQFPFYLGTEFLPDETERSRFFPIPHMDLQKIDYADECFDVFISGDVFGHIPDLDKALREIHRVLRPGGIVVSSFPFDPGRDTTVVKASLDESGQIIHHAEPEYHGNPVAPAEGSLVFTLPGWDLLPKLKAWGFADAYLSMIASSHFGVASNSQLGVFILTAVKESANPGAVKRPYNVVAKTALPDKLCALIALPRSGTTMLTSVFAVHSRCEAVYEPWNGKRISGEASSTIDNIARVEHLPNLSGRVLFVKETTAFHGSITGIRWLINSTPFPVEKHLLVLLRKPEFTFLSEIERRKEWWKDDVNVNEATFENWAEKSRLALQQMLDLGVLNNGTAILLEDFAASPAELLGQLTQRIGLNVEPRQLEYEKHLDKRRVRGDLNVSERPSKIAVSATDSRIEKVGAIEDMVSAGSHAIWFAAFRQLYDAIHRRGGIMSIRDIPKPVLGALFDNDESTR